jgi:hypothetical protein
LISTSSDKIFKVFKLEQPKNAELFYTIETEVIHAGNVDEYLKLFA